MSSYLLLRNNKETGPFTIEEIRSMSLKPQDLVWVVGKSAAWRYPGEISEFKSFAPPIPDLPSNPFAKKNTEEVKPETGVAKKTDAANHNGQGKNDPHRQQAPNSVYVNLPMERSRIPAFPERETLLSIPYVTGDETAYGFSDIYKKQSSGAARVSGKVLWFSTIALLFGAGILTGFFISDRRKFFSQEANHTPKAAFTQLPASHGQKENNQILIPVSQQNLISDEPFLKSETDLSGATGKKTVIAAGRKNLKTPKVKKDSLFAAEPIALTYKLKDSIYQNTITKTDVLYQKVKLHPENYLSLVTGTYHTGFLGGISSFPVSLTNNAPILMDLIVVTVDYIQNNNKIFKTESLSFTDLEPGETVSLKAPKSNRGIKIATHIHVVNIRQLDLSYSN